MVINKIQTITPLTIFSALGVFFANETSELIAINAIHQSPQTKLILVM